MPDAVRPPLQLKWRVKFCKIPGSVLLESGGAVCAASKDFVSGTQTQTDAVALYDLTGKLLWHIPNAVPLYLKGRRLVVVVGKAEGAHLECYDWKTRQSLWTRPAAMSSPINGAIENGGRLYVSHTGYDSEGPDRSWLKAWNLQDGTPLGTYVGEGWAVGPPACDGKYVYYGASHWLHVLDAKTLQPRFAFFDGGNAYLICSGEHLVAKGWQGYIHDWNITSRHLTWQIGGPREMAHCLVKDSQGRPLLIESSTAIDLESSRRVWRNPVFVDGGSAIGVGRLVYMAGNRSYGPPSKKGGFYAFDIDTGKPRWAYERAGLVGETIIAGEGRIYAVGSDGYLYCFAPASEHRQR
jgi:outer membrane protein assembly factor BamB